MIGRTTKHEKMFCGMRWMVCFLFLVVKGKLSWRERPGFWEIKTRWWKIEMNKNISLERERERATWKKLKSKRHKFFLADWCKLNFFTYLSEINLSWRQVIYIYKGGIFTSRQLCIRDYFSWLPQLSRIYWNIEDCEHNLIAITCMVQPKNDEYGIFFSKKNT